MTKTAQKPGSQTPDLTQPLARAGRGTISQCLAVPVPAPVRVQPRAGHCWSPEPPDPAGAPVTEATPETFPAPGCSRSAEEAQAEQQPGTLICTLLPAGGPTCSAFVPWLAECCVELGSGSWVIACPLSGCAALIPSSQLCPALRQCVHLHGVNMLL